MAAKGAKKGGHGPHRRGGHEEEHEEHVNHERWLVTYADMLTLLMVLFIVLFAISQVDSKKYEALKTGLATGFGSKAAILSGSTSLLDMGTSIAPALANLSVSPQSANAPENTLEIDVEKVAELVEQLQSAAVSEEVDKLTEAEKQLKAALKEAGESNAVNFGYSEEGLVLVIADTVLFPNGSATITDRGTKVLRTLCPTLKKLPNELSLNGHTNSVPISTSQFTSNWELSAARATGSLRYLNRSCDLPMGRMRAVGYADTQPLVTPKDSATAKVRNRRVEIVVLAALSDSLGEQLVEDATDAG